MGGDLQCFAAPGDLDGLTGGIHDPDGRSVHQGGDLVEGRGDSGPGTVVAEQLLERGLLPCGGDFERCGFPFTVMSRQARSHAVRSARVSSLMITEIGTPSSAAARAVSSLIDTEHLPQGIEQTAMKRWKAFNRWFGRLKHWFVLIGVVAVGLLWLIYLQAATLGTPIHLGSIGEWVSGVGAIAAVITAIEISRADREQRLEDRAWQKQQERESQARQIVLTVDGPNHHSGSPFKRVYAVAVANYGTGAIQDLRITTRREAAFKELDPSASQVQNPELVFTIENGELVPVNEHSGRFRTGSLRPGDRISISHSGVAALSAFESLAEVRVEWVSAWGEHWTLTATPEGSASYVRHDSNLSRTVAR